MTKTALPTLFFFFLLAVPAPDASELQACSSVQDAVSYEIKGESCPEDVSYRMESFGVKCTVESMSPLPSNVTLKKLAMSLQKEGKPLVSGLQSRVSGECTDEKNSVTVQFLVTGPLQRSDSGTYQCLAVVGNNTLLHEVPVKIKDDDRKRLLVLEGNPANMNCSSMSPVEFRYWTDPKDKEPAGKEEGDFLVIENATCDDQGEYTCFLILADSTVVEKKTVVIVIKEILPRETSEHVVMTLSLCRPSSDIAFACENEDELKFDLNKMNQNGTLWESEWTKQNCKYRLSCSRQALNTNLDHFKSFCPEESTNAPKTKEPKSSNEANTTLVLSVCFSVAAVVIFVVVFSLIKERRKRKRKEDTSTSGNPKHFMHSPNQASVETQDTLSEIQKAIEEQRSKEVHETRLQ
eukprot:m.12046 g.12046  ORF g.12046 m.12046 type:complete len:407 (+) comp23781_c0_seq2:1971-3191(+)